MKAKLGYRVLSVVLSLMMILSFVPITAVAADTAESTAITTSEGLVAAIASANDGDTITLGEGEFTTYGKTSPKKSLTFVGAGKGTVWTIGDLNGSGGDYSFEGCGTITFRDMTLKTDNANYRGFAHITNTVVDNCVLEGRTTYWGYTSAVFKNSTFNAPENDYALWDYSSKSMTFDTCIFNVSGKVINVFNEGGDAGEYGNKTVELKDCTVNSTKQNKAVLNIKNDNLTVDVKLSGTNTITGDYITDETTKSPWYQVENPAPTASSGKPVKIREVTTDENGNEVITTLYEVKAYSAAAKVGDKEYVTVNAAIAAAESGQTVTLLADVTEDVVIDKNITLDLGGNTITNTNAGASTVVVKNGAVATVKNGTVIGGTSYYNIEVVKDSNATLTLEDITATAGNTGSSMIDNWGTLTINGGTYTGGLNVVKSEENSTLVINGGKFELNYATSGYTATILVYGDTIINGGEFIQGATVKKYQYPYVVITGVVENTKAPITRITGGVFKNNSTTGIFHGLGKATSANFEVSGGTFNKSISDGYCADGFIPTKNADGTYGVKEGKYVAKVSGTGYETLGEAIDKLGSKNYTLTLLDESAWSTDTPVYWKLLNTTTDGYAKTLAEALTEAYKANTDGKTIKIVCRPGADVGAMTHGHVADTIQIYGNNAYISGGECDLEVDTYKFSRKTGAQAEDGEYLEKDIKITAYELGNLGVWGQRNTGHKVTVNLTKCNGITIEGKNVQRVYISGTTGTNDITLDSCKFITADTAVYSNADGAITIKKCTFTGSKAPVNFNHKAGGKQTISISNCTFTNCGDAGDWKQFAAPIRFVNSSSNGTMTATVTSCTFTDTVGTNGDILIGDGRIGKASRDVSLTVKTNATVVAQKPGYYADDGSVKDDSKRAEMTTVSTKQVTTSINEMLGVAIVDGHYYQSLEEAVAAAEDGQTVKLLKDSSGNGIVVKADAFPNGLTVDFNGYTYTVGGVLVGSSGTGTNAFQLLKGNKITFMNGTIEGVSENTKPAEDTPDWHGAPAMVIQNYCDLTLKNMTVSGGDETVYTVSNNNGDVVIEDTVINAGGAKGYLSGPFAFDVCRYSSYPSVSVTVKGNSVINGDVEVSGKIGDGQSRQLNIENGTFNGEFKVANEPANIAISGGTFKTAIKDEWCAEGFIPTTNEDGTYTVKEGKYVAETGGVKYESLQEAIDAAKSGATVKLISDTRENVSITKKLTLDLNGFTLNGGTEKGKAALYITARVTVKDSSEAGTGTIKREDTAENSGISSYYVMDIQGDAWVTFEGGNVTNNSGIVGVKGASLVRIGDDSKAKYPGLTIKGGTFTQDNFIAIKVDRGDLFLNGGTVNSANSYAIENWLRATINGGTINGAVASWTYSGGANSTLNIKGGTINGNVTSVNYGNAEDKVARVYITGGTVTGELDTRSYDPKTNELTSIDNAAKATIEVTGGTFDIDPTKYVTEAAKVNKNEDGTFGVERVVLATVDGKDCYTMDEAVKAQTSSGGTIIMQRDYKTNKIFNSGSINRTVDLNGHIWFYTGTDADSAAFEINYPDVKLTVTNGSVISDTMVGLIPTASSMNGTITYDNAGLVFDSVTLTANGHSGIETNGTNTNDTVTLINSILNVPNGYGIYFPSSGKLTIDSSTINAKTTGIQICAGSLDISGDSYISVVGETVEKTENDGAIEDGNAISIVDRAGYKGLEGINISGGNFQSVNGSAIKAYGWKDNAETEFVSDKNIINVEGGTFSSEVPAEYCKDGYKSVKNENDTYSVKKIAFRVVLESSPKNAGILTGGGDYAEGETVTITAEPVGGYRFLGWYKDGNELTTDTTYNVPAGTIGEVTYTAKYVGNENRNLTVNVGQGTVTAQYGSQTKTWKADQTNRQFLIGTKFTLTANPYSGFEFLYWVNKDRRIVSEQATFEFVLGGNSEYTAVYREIEPETAYVIVRNGVSDRILASGDVEDDGTFAAPVIYENGIYKFKGWFDKNGNEYTVNEDGKFTGITESVTIYAEYEEVGTEYTVTTTIDGEETTAKYKYGDTATVTADAEKDGKFFTGWYNVDGKLISTETTYSFAVIGNITLEARYGDEAVIAEPVVNMTVVREAVSDTDGIAGRVTMTVSWNVPEGYTFVGAGLVRTYDATKKDSLTLNAVDGTSIRQNRTTSEEASATYICSLPMKAETFGKDMYIRGYVTYMNAAGDVVTQYTEIVTSPATQQ